MKGSLSRPEGNPYTSKGAAFRKGPYSVYHQALRHRAALDVSEALAAAKGNVSQAARRLGVHRLTLYYLLKSLGLTRPVTSRVSEPKPSVSYRPSQERAARDAVFAALQKFQGNRVRAARYLGISRSRLHTLLHDFPDLARMFPSVRGGGGHWRG